MIDYYIGLDFRTFYDTVKTDPTNIMHKIQTNKKLV